MTNNSGGLGWVEKLLALWILLCIVIGLALGKYFPEFSQSLAIGTESLIANSKNADEVVILDGCPMLCAKKIADAQGVPSAQHLVMTELGITKGPSKNYTEDDIEKIVSACWGGEGKKKNAQKPSKKNGGPDSGCGCGCGGTC